MLFYQVELIKHGHDNVLNKGSGGLVDICFYGKAGVQTILNNG